MTCALIACTYRERLWCWDFVEQKTMCATHKIVVALKGKTMVTEPRPAYMAEFRLVNVVKTETKENENA